MAFALVLLNPPTPDDDAGSIGILQHVAVTAADFERYIRADAVGRELMEGGLRAYADHTHAQIGSFLGEVARQVERTGEANAHFYYRSAWERAGACAFLSFASAVHLFQEQTEAAAARVGGEPAKAKVHALFRATYTENREHYLIYRLRNLMVHFSMQCVYLDLASPQAQRKGQSHCLRMSREIILSATDGVHGALRSWIESLESDPDIAPLATAAMQSLQRTFQAAIPLTHPSGEEHLAVLRELDRKLGPVEGARAVAKLPDDFSHSTFRSELHVITQDVFEYAKASMS